jgi:hypothetical protein
MLSLGDNPSPGSREAGGTPGDAGTCSPELVQGTGQREREKDDDPYHLKGRMFRPEKI